MSENKEENDKHVFIYNIFKHMQGKQNNLKDPKILLSTFILQKLAISLTIKIKDVIT